MAHLEQVSDAAGIPHEHTDDYNERMAAQRRAFVQLKTDVDLAHVGHYSLDRKLVLH